MEKYGIVFTTKLAAMEFICELLRSLGKSVVTFHGKLSAKRRSAVVEDFNAGKVDWVVATRAGNRGLNLKRGNVVLHFDAEWSGASFTQRDRVTRRDSDLSKTTHQYMIMAEDSAEKVVYDRIAAKIRVDEELKRGRVRSAFGMSWKKFLVEKFLRVYKVNLLAEALL